MELAGLLVWEWLAMEAEATCGTVSARPRAAWGGLACLCDNVPARDILWSL